MGKSWIKYNRKERCKRTKLRGKRSHKNDVKKIYTSTKLNEVKGKETIEKNAEKKRHKEHKLMKIHLPNGVVKLRKITLRHIATT